MNTPPSQSSSPKQPAPPLIIDEALVNRLISIAESAMHSAPDVAERLLEEIDRAELLPTAEMPDTVVTIGSQVTYQDRQNGSVRTIYLVLPEKADPSSQRFSVVSPVGAALIGLSVNQMMSWQPRNGESRELTVLAVSNPTP